MFRGRRSLCRIFGGRRCFKFIRKVFLVICFKRFILVKRFKIFIRGFIVWICWVVVGSCKILFREKVVDGRFLFVGFGFIWLDFKYERVFGFVV